MVSAKAKYALRAAIALAEHYGQGLLSSAAVAERESIPDRFCENIVGDLKKAGLFFSEKGKAGGYRMARPPGEICVAEVLRAIDGPIAPAECVSAGARQRCKECPGEGECHMRDVFVRARVALLTVYEGVTLADLVALRRGDASN